MATPGITINLAALTDQQLVVINPVAFSTLDPADLQALTPHQVSILLPIQIQHFVAIQARAVSPQQKAVLSPAQISAFLNPVRLPVDEFLTGRNFASKPTAWNFAANNVLARAPELADNQASTYVWVSLHIFLDHDAGVEYCNNHVHDIVSGEVAILETNNTADPTHWTSLRTFNSVQDNFPMQAKAVDVVERRFRDVKKDIAVAYKRPIQQLIDNTGGVEVWERSSAADRRDLWTRIYLQNEMDMAKFSVGPHTQKVVNIDAIFHVGNNGIVNAEGLTLQPLYQAWLRHSFLGTCEAVFVGYCRRIEKPKDMTPRWNALAQPANFPNHNLLSILDVPV